MRIVAGAWRGRSLVAPPGQATRPTADRVRQALFDMLIHAEWGGRAAIEGVAVLDVFAGTGALGLEALSRGAATACFIESDAVALKALRANVTACKAEDRTRVIPGDALRINAAIPVSRPVTATSRTTTVSWPGLARPSTTGGSGCVKVVGSRAKPGHDTVGDTKDTAGGPDTRATADVHGVAPAIGRSGITGMVASGDTSGASLVFLDPPYAQNLVPRAIVHLRQTGHIAPGALIVAETGRDETWLPEETVLAERQHGAARILVFRLPFLANERATCHTKGDV